jgi:hypothetical protein
MKYLKYFEDVENIEPEIKEGQQWIHNDKSKICIIQKINPINKTIGILVKDDRNTPMDVDKKHILDNYTLIENKSYNNIDLNFNKTTYIEDEKSIIGAYFILEQNDKEVKILDIKEHKKETVYMDNATPYTISVQTIILPMNKIEILFEDELRKGFFYIKIPYWLYRNNIDQLEIKRVSDPNKRIDIQKRDYDNKKIIDAFKQEKIFDYFKSSNFDKRTQTNVRLFYDRLKALNKI